MEARAAAYAEQSGLTAYLQIVSSSLDELEDLAASRQRPPDWTKLADSREAGRVAMASNFMDLAACALSASVLQCGVASELNTSAGARASRRPKPPGAAPGEDRGSPSASGSGRTMPCAGDSSYPTRDAAVKAEVCRSLSDFTTDVLEGRLTLPAELSWAQAVSGSRWLGVSLAFRTAHAMRGEAARAFANYTDRVTRASTPSRAGSLPKHTQLTGSERAEQRRLFLRALLEPTQQSVVASSAASISARAHPAYNAEAESLARFFLRAHCSGVSDELWEQVLTLARAAVSVSFTAAPDASLRPVRTDVMLLRCLLLYMAAPTAFRILSVFRNRDVRTLATAAVCPDRGEIPREVVKEVLCLESSVATRLEDASSLNDACRPQPVLVAVLYAKSFWLWASRPYSGAWTHYYMG